MTGDVPELAGTAADYDPLKQMVLVVRHVDGTLTAHSVTHAPLERD